jgi:uncharacterized protein (DUF2252 family)
MGKSKRLDTAVADRQPVLKTLRNLKMARSVHAYVRGNTAQFYEWLEEARFDIPQGPPVWICGDCHIGNLGPIASAKGRIDVQIRDLDQTVIGNPAHDLIRLGLSLASAARGSDLPGVTTARMIEEMTAGYEQAFMAETDMPDEPEAVTTAMEAALQRRWKDLARERISDTQPAIPLGKTYWPISKDEGRDIRALFEDEKLRRLVTSLRSRDDDARIEVLDAAYWVKGCSSLGNLRYAALIGIGEARKDREVCLMDIKEALRPLAPRYPDVSMPKDNGDRVVEGGWHLSPALGERMVAGHVQDRPVFLRELLPQDVKFRIEHITQDEAMKVARFLAGVVGKAHARQMDEVTRKNWRAELGRKRSKTLNAPSWLWSAIVELIKSHEGAYLEHCRKFALGLA